MDLYSKRVFEYFNELCKIPHGSGNTKEICKYLENFAKEHNLWYTVDSYGNIIIKKDGTEGYEHSEPVIVQGHMDMVCEKTPECNIDFVKDGLDVKTEGDYIFAKGTTLGGDDGIAVAYAMALLASGNIPHPPLEVVITADEEIGLLGAGALDVSSIKGKLLLNIDSEEEGVLLTSCAGGLVANSVFKIEREPEEKPLFELKISGLEGGHSGVEINKGNANSNILMGRVLYALGDKVRLNSVNGGLKDNAIPRESVALISTDDEDSVRIILDKVSADIKNEYFITDKNLDITFSDTESVGVVLTEKSHKDIVFFLHSVPDGVISMSKSIENLVETSLNFGVLKTEEEIVCQISVRSSVESAKYEMCDKIEHITEYIGGSFTVDGDYPGWEYKEHSKLRNIMSGVFEKQYGHPPKIQAIHAGLECGILCGKIPELDCVSFGPDIFDIHTTSERMSISSVERTGKFLLEVLKNLK